MGLSPLHQAAKQGNLDELKKLHSEGADLNEIHKNGSTH